MTFTEHLGELRDRLIKSILVIGAGAIIVFLFYDPILTFLGGPYEDFCRATPDQCSLGGDFIITSVRPASATRRSVRSPTGCCTRPTRLRERQRHARYFGQPVRHEELEGFPNDALILTVLHREQADGRGRHIGVNVLTER